MNRTQPKATAKEKTAASRYTHSAWTGKKYARRQTHAELLAESMAILRNHPTIGKTLGGSK